MHPAPTTNSRTSCARPLRGYPPRPCRFHGAPGKAAGFLPAEATATATATAVRRSPYCRHPGGGRDPAFPFLRRPNVKNRMTICIRKSRFAPFATRMFASASLPTQSGLRRDDELRKDERSERRAKRSRAIAVAVAVAVVSAGRKPAASPGAPWKRQGRGGKPRSGRVQGCTRVRRRCRMHRRRTP